MATAKERLTRERILEVAGALVAGEGLEALSMRRLAEELDVWPMSVYRYFRDKDELLDAVTADAAAFELPEPGGDWRDRVRALLHEVRRAMASPELAGRWPRAFLTPGALRLTDAGLAALESAGLPPDEAASAWRSLWSYTFGFATFSVAPTSAEAVRRTRTALAALPDEDYPALARTGGELAAVLADEAEFDRGLDRLLDGLGAAPRPRRS